MDLLESMRVFVEAVDRGSLSAAAEACGISPTMAGNHLRSLEARTGTRLLHRTTRRQSLSAFGQSYYERCLEILRLVETTDQLAEAEQRQPGGLLRVTAPLSFGSEALMPALGDYLAMHPAVTVDAVLNDRTVDLVEEGFEAAIRVGRLRSTDLVARPLQPYGMLVCASPAYLRSQGRPRTPDDLLGHECLSFSLGSRAPWRFAREGREWAVPVRGRLQVNSGQALRVAALHGMGIIRQPAALLREDVAAGRLVRLLPGYELPSQPMHIVYLQDRYRSPRLRSFVDFIAERFGAARAGRP